MSKRPMVSGANGFSGRLIAEFLREYNRPFIAAGRRAWGGFPQPVWCKNRPPVVNVRSLRGLLDRQIMEGVAATEKMFEEQIRPLPKAEREEKLAERAKSVQAGTAPRENPREQRTIDVVVGTGSTDYAQCVLFGTCCYRQTSLLQAFAATHLVHAAPRKVGFASPAEAFGHQETLRPRSPWSRQSSSYLLTSGD